MELEAKSRELMQVGGSECDRQIHGCRAKGTVRARGFNQEHQSKKSAAPDRVEPCLSSESLVSH